MEAMSCCLVEHRADRRRPQLGESDKRLSEERSITTPHLSPCGQATGAGRCWIMIYETSARKGDRDGDRGVFTPKVMTCRSMVQGRSAPAVAEFVATMLARRGEGLKRRRGGYGTVRPRSPEKCKPIFPNADRSPFDLFDIMKLGRRGT